MKKSAAATKLVDQFADVDDHELAVAALTATCDALDLAKAGTPMPHAQALKLYDLVTEAMDRMAASNDDARSVRAVTTAARDMCAAWARVSAMPGVELDSARRFERELEDVLNDARRRPLR